MQNKKPGRVTIKTISKELGVSPATVSKALRDCSDISEEMKLKVRTLTDLLGYQPNLLARSLVKRKSNLIGVIIPDINISYYAYLVQHIYENAQIRGYESIVMFHHENPEKERKNLQVLTSLQVDGLLVSVTRGNKNEDLLKRILSKGIPIVSYDRKPQNSEFSNVSMDDYVETEVLIRAFIERGRKKIGYIGIINGDDATIPRYNCYRRTLDFLNLPFDLEQVVECLPNIDDAERQMHKALQNGLDIDAILCAGGLFAYGAGKAILAEGYKMPEDIILGEYGNNNIVQRLGISFFSVDHSPELIASEAVRLLDSFLKEKSRKWNPQQIFVKSKLIYHDHFNHEEKIMSTVN